MTTPVPPSGNQKRRMKSASRLYAVQALYQMELSGTTAEKTMREFLDYRFGAEVEEGVELVDGDVVALIALQWSIERY